MRVSDQLISKIIDEPRKISYLSIDLAQDLRDARAEIAQLKKENDELKKLINELREGL